jgi:hypothetical protein
MAYTSNFLQPARTAMLALIDTGAARPRFKVYNDGAVLLATLPLANPAGSVDPVTSQIVLTPGDSEASAPTTGTASYATLEDGDGVVLADDIPVVAGLSPVPGSIVISSVYIVEGSPVSLASAVIG